MRKDEQLVFHTSKLLEILEKCIVRKWSLNLLYCRNFT